jgi:hypothetical protein
MLLALTQVLNNYSVSHSANCLVRYLA